MIMPTSKLKGIVWLCFGILVAGSVAVGLPALIAKIPWSYEKRFADRLGSEILECKKTSDPALQKLLKAIYPVFPEDNKFDIDVHIARGPTINAFAYLGGEIYIYEGLLRQADSADEIAGVLAHEIAHVARRHILQGVVTRLLTFASFQMIFTGPSGTGTEILNLVLNMQFTRDQEIEADHDGLIRLKKASVNTLGYANFFKKLEKLSIVPALISDHPPSDLRADEAKKMVVESPVQILSPTEWQGLKNICGDDI